MGTHALLLRRNCRPSGSEKIRKPSINRQDAKDAKKRKRKEKGKRKIKMKIKIRKRIKSKRKSRSADTPHLCVHS